MRRRPSAVIPTDWPATLRWIVQSAESEVPPGHADAMRELAFLALRKIPARGVFEPAAHGDNELLSTIESVARTHLELSDARTSWHGALKAAHLDFEKQDQIEQAALHVQLVSDTAYFYAGLMFGLAFAEARGR